MPNLDLIVYFVVGVIIPGLLVIGIAVREWVIKHYHHHHPHPL